MPAALHRKPVCHPDRRYKAFDLCNACYQRDYKRKNPDAWQRWAESKSADWWIDYRQRTREKVRERSRLWRLAHPRPPRVSRAMSHEEKLARHRLFYQANRDRLNAKRREWYHRNKEKEHVRSRSYRQRNRDVLRIRGRARYWRDHDKSLEWSRRSYQRHKTERRLKHKAYRESPASRPRRLESKRRYYNNLPETREKRLERMLRKLYARRSYQVQLRENRAARAKARTRKRAQRQREQLAKVYIRRLLARGTTLKPEDFSPEIVRLAKLRLRLLRAAKSTLKGNNK